MLRILIADDERLIRAGLRDLLNAEPGFSVVEAVSNGEEALNAVRREQPDVVLTDIRMPRMDGRELVRELHRSYPKIRKVIISGYEDFSYAHETMKNGAIDYLLKPVDERELVELLRGIEAEVTGEEKRSNENRELHSKLEQSLPLLREEFLLDLLHGCALSEGGIAERLEFLGMNAGQSPYCAVRVNAGPSMPEVIRLAGEAVRTLATFLACEENGAAAFILGRPQGLECWTPDAAVNAIGAALGGDAAIGVGGAAERLSGIAGSYREAACALKRRFYDEETRVFRYERIRGEAGSQGSKLPENFQEKLYAGFINALETEKTEAVNDLLSRAGSTLKESNVEANAVLKLFSGLFSMLQSQSAAFRKAMDEACGPDYLYFKTIEKFDTLGGIIRYTTGVYLDIIEKIRANRFRRDKGRVEIVKEYVGKNYRENITLAVISSLVYVNPNYFCEMFKNQTGENFVDYLTRVRMEKAKALLRDMKIKTYEVGMLVGYEDSGYFCKVFKKLVGTTPGKYRNLG